MSRVESENISATPEESCAPSIRLASIFCRVSSMKIRLSAANATLCDANFGSDDIASRTVVEHCFGDARTRTARQRVRGCAAARCRIGENAVFDRVHSMNETNLATLRREYAQKTLSETEVMPDPIAQFSLWMNEAIAGAALEPTAMTLATVGANGRPSARIVLLKGCDARGFVFFTNYSSRKGIDLGANRFASLVFMWKELERQVRIEGAVE